MLMEAVCGERHSLCRRLLALPGLDTNLATRGRYTALHFACMKKTPLDIVILIACLSRTETVNQRNSVSYTALDYAVEGKRVGAALHLSWLGAECRQSNTRPGAVSLQSWREAGCLQEAQYWAVAANNISALTSLSVSGEVSLDGPGLRRLARQCGSWEAWQWAGRLQLLAWETVSHAQPVLATLPPARLVQAGVPGHVVRVLLSLTQNRERENRVEQS